MKRVGLVALVSLAAFLAGCEPVSLTLLGVGAGAGVSHHMGGLAYRTFTEPLPKVKRATMRAFNRMAINLESAEKTANGEILKAKAADRSIEVELEALTPKTTRISAVARKASVLVDSATAVEIIAQTEKALGS